jgi:hypothetical protein
LASTSTGWDGVAQPSDGPRQSAGIFSIAVQTAVGQVAKVEPVVHADVTSVKGQPSGAQERCKSTGAPHRQESRCRGSTAGQTHGRTGCSGRGASGWPSPHTTGRLRRARRRVGEN